VVLGQYSLIFIHPGIRCTLSINFGRPRTRWADNVRKDLREVGLSEDDWKDHARDGTAWHGVVGAAMDF
jgi:hypothetical protein